MIDVCKSEMSLISNKTNKETAKGKLSNNLSWFSSQFFTTSASTELASPKFPPIVISWDTLNHVIELLKQSNYSYPSF